MHYSLCNGMQHNPYISHKLLSMCRASCISLLAPLTDISQRVSHPASHLLQVASHAWCMSCITHEPVASHICQSPHHALHSAMLPSRHLNCRLAISRLASQHLASRTPQCASNLSHPVLLAYCSHASHISHLASRDVNLPSGVWWFESHSCVMHFILHFLCHIQLMKHGMTAHLTSPATT